MYSVTNRQALNNKNNFPPISKWVSAGITVVVGLYGVAFAAKSMHAISFPKNSCDFNKIKPLTHCLHIASYGSYERPWPQDGHSLISISPYKPECLFSENDDHIIYETGPKGFRNNTLESFLAGGELLIHEKGWNDKRERPTQTKYYAIRSIPLDACHMRYFKELVTYLLGLKYSAWSILNNCAQTSRDIWVNVAQEELSCNPTWACIPQDLFKSIESANKASLV
ncbi:MAG: hypothetical protein V4629_04085 [Pseudomonadota bacterium]